MMKMIRARRAMNARLTPMAMAAIVPRGILEDDVAPTGVAL